MTDTSVSTHSNISMVDRQVIIEQGYVSSILMIATPICRNFSRVNRHNITRPRATSQRQCCSLFLPRCFDRSWDSSFLQLNASLSGLVLYTRTSYSLLWLSWGRTQKISIFAIKMWLITCKIQTTRDVMAYCYKYSTMKRHKSAITLPGDTVYFLSRTPKYYQSADPIVTKKNLEWVMEHLSI